MAPTIHIFRCAKGIHSGPQPANQLLPYADPELADQGRQQSAALAAELAFGGGIELVFASPMQRAIQTALTVFETYTQSKRIVLLPDLRESNSLSSSPDDLLRKFGDQCLDFSFMTPDWTDNNPQSRYNFRFNAPRGSSTRLFLRAVAQRYRDTDAHIVVVTHGSYIKYLIDPPPAEPYKHAEYRSYKFERIAGDTEARLIETPCSISRRQKAKSASKPGPPSNFGLSLPTFGLHTNMPGTHPTTPSCGGTTSCGGPTPPSCGGPTSTSCGGQQVSNVGAPALTASKDMNSTVNEKSGMKPNKSPLTKMSAPKPTVSNSNVNTTNSMKTSVPQTIFSGLSFDNINPVNPVSPGNSNTSVSYLSNKKTASTPLFNPYNKKQKTAKPFSLFDEPGEKATEYPPLFEWQGKNNSNKTT
ncbi:histidine phosphatase superfamily [Xylaria scruposa]|nr:histidine phosphatase superfamily [Xylaria scruposa]